jgi:hypothetical protein
LLVLIIVLIKTNKFFEFKPGQKGKNRSELCLCSQPPHPDCW